MSFCIKCGRTIDENAAFCSGCGEPVKKEIPVEQEDLTDVYNFIHKKQGEENDEEI